MTHRISENRRKMIARLLKAGEGLGTAERVLGVVVAAGMELRDAALLCKMTAGQLLDTFGSLERKAALADYRRQAVQRVLHKEAVKRANERAESTRTKTTQTITVKGGRGRFEERPDVLAIIEPDPPESTGVDGCRQVAGDAEGPLAWLDAAGLRDLDPDATDATAGQETPPGGG